MKAYEIMNSLFALADDVDFSNTCDTCKAGDPNVEVSKVAVTMFPTPQTVKDAKAWGAQLLIVHEPAYYNHMDEYSQDKLEVEKRELIEKSGLTVIRFHDHPHYTTPDMIAAGELRELALEGKVAYTDTFDLVRIQLDAPMTPVALAKRIEDRLGIRHVRICGARDAECTKVSAMFGAPAGVLEELQNDACEILLVGETCEWAIGEYARDAAQLGYKKALLILGHVGSERAGMVYTADVLKQMHPELEVRYFENGEVYTYTDPE